MSFKMCDLFKGINCLSEGSDLSASKSKGACVCNYTRSLPETPYFGPHCDIPSSVGKAQPIKTKGKTLCRQPSDKLWGLMLRMLDLISLARLALMVSVKVFYQRQ